MGNYYLAVDLGATSGRVILAQADTDTFEIEEIYRFPNNLIQKEGHSYWDIDELYRNVLEGFKIVASTRDVHVKSIGIDAWGVDFILLGRDGSVLAQPYSYHDVQTDGAPEEYFSRVSRDAVYAKTGIQVMNFNSLFQFDTLRRNRDKNWKTAKKILFIPDALSYFLTGRAVTEYTIATTAQIVDASSRKLDPEILSTVGLKSSDFGEFVYPGTIIGTLTPDVQKATGLGAVPVIAVGGHDTASAVAAVPAKNSNFAYLSSGTWSLMGVETDHPVINSSTAAENFTNEGGVTGNIRLLKNICGMWLLEGCRRLWGDVPYEELLAEARVCDSFRSLINPDDLSFANPNNMVLAIQEFCLRHGQPIPQVRGQVVRCIFESLALRYRQVLEKLRQLSPVDIEVLHIIGGGSRNALLNQFTANAIQIPVFSGPAEATAIGNVMVQAITQQKNSSLAEMRKLLAASLPLSRFEPQDKELWGKAYNHYLKVTR